MDAMFEELDYQITPLGALILRRRKVPQLGDRIVYEVLLNREFLMSSLFHRVEDALAELGLAAVPGSDLGVAVVGLGLGYTAWTALQSERVASLLVIEYLQPVIEWHRNGMVPLGQRLMADARTRSIEADFFNRAEDPAAGLDPEQPGRRFHAVLLDIDHTPQHWLNPRHAAFYGETGLQRMRQHLHPGGVFAMWADGPIDPGFRDLLASVFSDARAHEIPFDNPLTGGTSTGTVYVGNVAP